MNLSKARKKQKKLLQRPEESKAKEPKGYIPIIYVLFGSHIRSQEGDIIYVSGPRLRYLYGLPKMACRYIEAHHTTKVNVLSMVEPPDDCIYLYARPKGNYKEYLEKMNKAKGVKDGYFKRTNNRRTRARIDKTISD